MQYNKAMNGEKTTQIKLSQWWQKWWWVTILSLILLLASFLRLHSLGQIKEYLFDECYHIPPARLIAKWDKKAFEWHHGDLSTEAEGAIDLDGAYIDWLHPPVHKYWQAINIAILGNNEIAWRLSSAISGVAVCGLAFWLADLCFKKKVIGLLAAGIIAVDPLMITQSRVGMNDMMVIALMVLAVILWKKWQENKETEKDWRWWIGMSVVMGLAVATKWSAVWIMIGLGLATLIDGQAKQKLQTFGKAMGRLVVFGGVALAIYCLSYVPALMMGHNVEHLLELHNQIFLYQKRTDLEHYRSSVPLEWVMGEKSIIYTTRAGQTPEVTLEANKMVLALGLASVVWSLSWLVWNWGNKKLKSDERKEQANLWLMAGMYVMAFGPWIFSPRIMFLYHYLPALPYLYVVMAFWIEKIFTGLLTVYRAQN